MWGNCRRCKWHKPLPYAQFMRFLTVGGVGFTIDAGLLLLLLEAGMGPLPGRIVSAAIAIGICWLINRRITFGAPGAPGWKEGARYYAVYAAGLAINFTVYTAVLFGPFALWGVKSLALLALIMASGAALLFHYAALRLWVFRQ